MVFDPMPELPEVETIARQLAPRLTGRVVASWRIHDRRLRTGRSPRLRGRAVTTVTRSGKRVLVGFSASPSAARPVWLTVHLRMTGRLIWSPDGPSPRSAHLRARFLFDRGALLFYDPRRFGTFDWHSSREAAEPAGVDPLSPELDGSGFAELIAGSRQNLKAWLLRQDRLTGLGNIYASEILHAARISPLREAGSLRGEEPARLYRAMRRVLRRAIRNCGTSFSDFQDARGMTGSYQRLLAVYGRERQPCPRCRSGILRLVQQQRSTFYCPGCQR